MALLGCATLDELFTRLSSSRQVGEWLEYLRLRDEEEAKKYQALTGQPQKA